MTAAKRGPKIFIRILISLVAFLLLGLIAAVVVIYYQLQRVNGTLISSGEKRAYLLHVPPGYQADQPTPLVISIHGFAEWPAHQMEISGWNRLADADNFIVVYPSGTGFPRRWRTGWQTTALMDVQFIADLIDRLESEYNIDPKRIYANGLSNGGGMSFALACNLSERIAAFGGVAGAYLLPWEVCNPQRPVPAIIFHGTADPIVPFGGGPSRSFDHPFPDIPTWVSELAAHNGCAAAPQTLPALGVVSGVHYTGCSQDAEVVFYTIANGGHSWPGGGYLPRLIVGETTKDIDATRVMWEFFQRHPMK